MFEAAATLRGLSSRVISGRIRKLRRDSFQFLTNENKLFENWRKVLTNIYEIPEVGVLPLWTDDRHAPLVVGTPWSEQVAKKTENAAKNS